MKIRFGFVVLALLLLGGPLFAQQTAVLKELTGMVQLKAPGGAWVTAKPGAKIDLGTVISTGFNSTAVLDLGTAQLQVHPLTRMRLDELLRQGNHVTTSVFLTVGVVHAHVDRLPSLTQSFQLRSPVSTAAVRGTQFTFGGNWVATHEGVVEFLNSAGLGRDVTTGESSELSGLSLPVSPGDYLAEHQSVDPHAGPHAFQSVGTPASSNTGTIVVTVN